MRKILSMHQILWASIIAMILLVFGVFSAISAQEQENPASGLQISPTRTELTINPGASDKIVVTLKNVTGGNIIAKPEINDFESDNNTGTPRIITDQNRKSAYTIRDFISNIPDTPMQSGESKKIEIPVNVPQGQSPGGYFGVIRFIAEPANSQEQGDGRQINLTASLGHIVLINVPGDASERLQLVSFSAEKNNKSGSIFSSAPDGLALGLANSGNTFVKPFGTVTIENFRGKIIYKYELNSTEPRGNILPGSTRIFHDALENVGSGPGKYKAVASVSYGNGGDVLVSETTFWVIPMWLKIAGIILILIILLLIFLVFRKLRGQERRYKNR